MIDTKEVIHFSEELFLRIEKKKNGMHKSLFQFNIGKNCSLVSFVTFSSLVLLSKFRRRQKKMKVHILEEKFQKVLNNQD